MNWLQLALDLRDARVRYNASPSPTTLEGWQKAWDQLTAALDEDTPPAGQEETPQPGSPEVERVAGKHHVEEGPWV